MSSWLLAVKLSFNFNAEVCQAGLFLSLAINPINIQKTCDPLSAKCISWTRFTSINPLNEAGLTPQNSPISTIATARTTPLCLVQRDRLSINDSYGLFSGHCDLSDEFYSNSNDKTYTGSQAPLLSGHIVASPLLMWSWRDLDLDLPLTATPGRGEQGLPRSPSGAT